MADWTEQDLKQIRKFREEDHPRGQPNNAGQFVEKRDGKIDLADEIVPRSIGAKYRNFDIKMPNGEMAHLAEGTHITNKEVFAGYGTKTPIRDVDRLVRQYGGNREKWAKVKAEAILGLHGKQEKAEIHWYEEPTVGKHEIKVKKYL